MQFHRLSANFGRLHRQTLTLHDGLNLIHAPNESGKSTWCAFLIAMLYGVNSRERDRQDYLAEKNRYAPWDGSPMMGRLDLQVGDDRVTIARATQRANSPMGSFSAVYTDTNTPLPDWTGASCGETLTGVPRSVYERSAFIRQAQLPIDGDAALEQRIVSLITTGDEDTSYIEAEQRLRTRRNRRKHNRTGQIPVLQQDISELEQQCAENDQLRQEQRSVEAEIAKLTQHREALMDALAQHDAADQQALQSALNEAQKAEQTATQRIELLQKSIRGHRLPDRKSIASLRAASAGLNPTQMTIAQVKRQVESAETALQLAEADLENHAFAGKTPEEAAKAAAADRTNFQQKSSAGLFLPSLILALLGAVGLSYGFLQSVPTALYAGVAGLVLAVVAALAARHTNKKRQRLRQTTLKRRYGISDVQQLSALTDHYAELWAARDEAQQEITRHTATLNQLEGTLKNSASRILLQLRRAFPQAELENTESLLNQCETRWDALDAAVAEHKEAALRLEFAQSQCPESAGDEPVMRPSHSREELQTALDAVNTQQSNRQSRLDLLQGKLTQSGDPSALTTDLDGKRTLLLRLTGEYDALTLALEALHHANDQLQTRFAPALGRRTAELFRKLTDGRYEGVTLDRTFRLQAQPVGDTLYRTLQYLSAGAADQLYLAARLAISEMVLPVDRSVPIVLDDALANFDDVRMEASLSLLQKIAKERQVILFTCHQREAQFLANAPDVHIQQLTNPVPTV